MSLSSPASSQQSLSTKVPPGITALSSRAAGVPGVSAAVLPLSPTGSKGQSFAPSAIPAQLRRSASGISRALTSSSSSRDLSSPSVLQIKAASASAGGASSRGAPPADEVSEPRPPAGRLLNRPVTSSTKVSAAAARPASRGDAAGQAVTARAPPAVEPRKLLPQISAASRSKSGLG